MCRKQESAITKKMRLLSLLRQHCIKILHLFLVVSNKIPACLPGASRLLCGQRFIDPAVELCCNALV